jgi:hypothetical protein
MNRRAVRFKTISKFCPNVCTPRSPGGYRSFPALHEVVSQHEYDALGEEFERIERKTFGGDGFDIYVDKIAAIEKELGIYDLAQFTPH